MVGTKVIVLEEARSILNSACAEKLPCEGTVTYQFAIDGFVVECDAWEGFGNPGEGLSIVGDHPSKWKAQNVFREYLREVEP